MIDTRSPPQDEETIMAQTTRMNWRSNEQRGRFGHADKNQHSSLTGVRDEHFETTDTMHVIFVPPGSKRCKSTSQNEPRRGNGKKKEGEDPTEEALEDKLNCGIRNPHVGQSLGDK